MKRPLESKAGTPSTKGTDAHLKHLFGFKWSDVTDWKAFVTLLSRPTDPSSLAILRILYGVLMMLDIPQERGLGRLHEAGRRYDPEDCQFPLFDFIRPLPLKWMYIVYLFMFAGAAGIALGFLYRLAAALFVVTYWYVFLLDTTNWNNHSFLFGLLAILLMFTDANRCWALDALRVPSLGNCHVPLWNYTAIRTQIFLVYFLAGLKKMDPDWLGGYSMRHLSSHWVFLPFRLFLSEETIDLHVVHHFGFAFDLTIGFFMFFDRSRPLAFVFCAAFNLMNSQMFNIGMFPFVMLATMPIFCRPDWPRRFLRNDDDDVPTPGLQTNSHCLYQQRKNARVGRPKIARFHHWAAGLTVAYIVIQLFLPYSHFVTKGYNHWSDGLYGYSWNMMVHSWTTQQVRVSVRHATTGQVDYLDPERFVSSQRWTRYAHLAQQFARCVERNVRQRQGVIGNESSTIEIYLDVWASLNQRFVQRMFDPRVNLLTANWSPFRKTRWAVPLLDELNDRWRDTIVQEETRRRRGPDITSELTFVADLPGFFMENSVHSRSFNLNVTSLEVLEGTLIVEILQDGIGGRNVSLQAGNTIKVPANTLHRVHVLSDTPAAYVYRTENATLVDGLLDEVSGRRAAKSVLSFWKEKYNCFAQSLKMTIRAIKSVIWQTSLEVDAWHLTRTLH